MPETTHDLLGVLKEDHDRICALLARLEDTRGDERLSLLHHIDRAFRVHAEAEEELIYPVYAECREDGEAMVEQHRAEHTFAKDLLTELMAMAVGSAAFEGRLRLLRKVIEDHVGHEEKEMLPALREGCSPAARDKLAKNVDELTHRLMSRFG